MIEILTVPRRKQIRKKRGTLSQPTYLRCRGMSEYTICDKPIDPAHAFALTFSPGSNPPTHIVKRAVPFTFNVPSDNTSSTPATAPTTPQPPLQSDLPISPSPSQPTPESTLPVKPPPPKSWASLFVKPPSSAPSPASSSPSNPPQSLPNAHPKSLASSTPSAPLYQPKIDPQSLLTHPSPLILSLPTPLTHPRGLVNAGNLCFANSILQALVHCPPMWRIFVEGLGPVFEQTGVLASQGASAAGTSGVGAGGGKTNTALLEAMLLFINEFKLASEVDVPMDPKPGEKLAGALAANGKKKLNGSTPGTPLTVEQLRRRSFLQDPFIPEFLYDALRENKRFDSMTVSVFPLQSSTFCLTSRIDRPPRGRRRISWILP